MAIYKNREVSVTDTGQQAIQPTTVRIRHKDGMQENVSIGDVSFTKSEKDNLVKNNKDAYSDVKIASDEDIKAVQAGVTPPSDPTFQDQAKASVQHQKQQEEVQKNLEAAKKQAEKDQAKK